MKKISKGIVSSDYWTCDTCNKRTYYSRKQARVAGKRIKASTINAYECPVHSGYWHLGNRPAELTQGIIDRATLRRSMRESLAATVA